MRVRHKVMLVVIASGGGVDEAVAGVVEDCDQGEVEVEERIVRVNVRQKGRWKRLGSWVARQTFVRLQFLHPGQTERMAVSFAMLMLAADDEREVERGRVQYTLHILAVTVVEVAVVANTSLRRLLQDSHPAYTHDCLASPIPSPHSLPAVASATYFHSDPARLNSSSRSYTSFHTCPNSSYADYSDHHACSPYRYTLDILANCEDRREVFLSATEVDQG